MTVLLMLSALLAAPDAGVPPVGSAHPQVPAAAQVARLPDGGVRPGTADGGAQRTEGQRQPGDGGTPVRPIVTRAPVDDGVPEPSTRISVQEPARPDAGTSRKKKARAAGTNGEGDPQMDALLEQSRAQTETLQQISAQQRATEDARIAEQQARSQRGLQMDDARSAIDGNMQSLQGSGTWSAGSLQQTRASLQQTAAAAAAAGSSVEASRAAEAARMVEAAEAALAQRNSQQAQYYLMQANQLIWNAQNVR